MALASTFTGLKDRLGALMGDPLTCAYASPENGDTLQQTSMGLAVYHNARNMPAFTNGFDHWAMTPDGLVHWTEDGADRPEVVEPSAPPVAPQQSSAAASAPVRFWTVNVATYWEGSLGARLAEELIRRLNSRGLAAEVLPSSRHVPLRSGYLVVSSGHFESASQANAHLPSILAVGFADAYPSAVRPE